MRRPDRPWLVVLVLALSGCGVAVPAATTTSEATPSGAQPSRSTGVSVPPSPNPTAESPSAGPSSTPDPAQMELEVIGCPGGVVLDWSPSTDPDFHHYTALRSPDEDIKPEYPPIAPAVDWGDTYATDPFVTSAVDASILPSDRLWHYKVMAYAANGSVVSASNVRAARLSKKVDLGTLEVEPSAPPFTRLSWRPFTGPSGCFSSYRILVGANGAAPTTQLTVLSDQSASAYETDAFEPGTTVSLEVQALRTTILGSFVAGQTDVATYEVP